jgi:tetratricopeptide (TPR) repeat protein
MHIRWAERFRLLLHIGGFSGAASARTFKQQAKWCNDPNPDLAISGCTAVIRSGRLTQGELALAFHARGNAYGRKREYDRAIRDYDQAIRLNPNDASVFISRGLAYRALGQQAQAAEDFATAGQLNPDLPPPEA